MERDLYIGLTTAAFKPEDLCACAHTAMQRDDIHFISADETDFYKIALWLHVHDASDPARENPGSCYHVFLSTAPHETDIASEVWIQLHPDFRNGLWRLAFKADMGMPFEAVHTDDPPYADYNEALGFAVAFLLSSLPREFGLKMHPWSKQVEFRRGELGLPAVDYSAGYNQLDPDEDLDSGYASDHSAELADK